MKLQLKNSSSLNFCTPKTLETVFSITYLPQIEYDHWRIEQYLRNKCASAYKKGKIPHHAIWLGTLHGKQLEKKASLPLIIRWIDDQKGYGVFADCYFQKWAFIGEYTGIVKRRKIFCSNINDYCFMYPRQWLNFHPMTIDSEKAGNYTRFINHSDFPNLESLAIYFKGTMHIIFRAIRDIHIGEELTYDYGDLYWKKRIKITENQV